MTEEAAVVLWAIGRTRAHLMRFDSRHANGAPPWRSPCGWDVRRYWPGVNHDAAAGDLPPVPWCSGCQSIAQRLVNGYLAAGIAHRTLPGLERTPRG